MRALFVNYGEDACGVHQYGLNLFAVLVPSSWVDWVYCSPKNYDEYALLVTREKPDVIVFNWQDGQGGFISRNLNFTHIKKCLVFHDGGTGETNFNAILFSDPTMTPTPGWHSIGRPIPTSQSLNPIDKLVTIGVHGFRGAQAAWVVAQVIKEFEYAQVRLSLPFSFYCDAAGGEALGMAEHCRNMVKGTGISVDVHHEFKEQDNLIEWLAGNTINCYFRDPSQHWRGVSSAPDCALAARRPLAVNKCSAFRHLHSTTPSICIEDSSLKDIISIGLTPLVPLYEKWSAENVRNEVDNIVLGL